MSRKWRKRRLTVTKMNPKMVYGKELFIPKLYDIQKEVRIQGGWNLEGYETQSAKHFKFDGRFFRHFMESILKMKVGKVYFPAAFTGKVALSLKEAGLDVLASDVSQIIVEHLMSLGLRVQRRSIEEIPNEPFDAVISFEPYCISSSILGYLAVLETLARGLPYIEIEEDVLQYLNMGNNGIGEKRIESIVNDIPKGLEEMTRIAYDYGARYQRFAINCTCGLFQTTCVRPSKKTMGRATIDLQLIKELNKLPRGGVLSITECVKKLERDEEVVAAAIHRLDRVFNSRFCLESTYNFKYGGGYYPIFGFMKRPKGLLRKYIQYTLVEK